MKFTLVWWFVSKKTKMLIFMEGIILQKCLISVAFQESWEETEAKIKIGMTQTKTVWLVGSFTNDGKQLFCMNEKILKSPFLPRGFRAPAPTGLENCPLSRLMTAACKMHQLLQSCPKSRWCRWRRTGRQPIIEPLIINSISWWIINCSS